MLGLEWIALSKLRSAILAEKAHTILEILKSTDRLEVCLHTGFYMLFTVWGWVAWILVVLGALVLDSVLFIALISLVNHPDLWISVQTRAAIPRESSCSSSPSQTWGITAHHRRSDRPRPCQCPARCELYVDKEYEGLLLRHIWIVTLVLTQLSTNSLPPISDAIQSPSASKTTR